MNRREILGLLGVSAAGLTAMAAYGADPADHSHGGPMEECAKACADCMRECESCADHCAQLVASGKKEHLTTLRSCADCAEFCAAAAKIVSRYGPLAVTICEACAKACDVCGAACAKAPDDKHMQRCAKACRDCAKACRDMVQHAGHEQRK
jgi:hypothetical protein